jgi:hypothetical protein
VLTRNALLAIVPFGADNPLSGWFEIYQRKPAKAIQLILHAAPHPMTSQTKCPGWKVGFDKKHLPNLSNLQDTAIGDRCVTTKPHKNPTENLPKNHETES